MASESKISDRVGFGEFEFDLATGELYEDGQKVRLSGQPVEVLRFLIRRAGSLVRREELRSALWPADTFVDFDHGLNSCILRIRQALRDSVGSPRYVETLPKQGYRFIGQLQAPIRPVVPVVAVEPDRGTHGRQMWLRIAAGVLAILVLVLGVVLAYRSHRQKRGQDQAALTAVPFTALAGEETSAAFSPDGSRIAFAWNGDPGNGGKGFDLYVKAIGSETLLRLTRHPSEWISAAWSPDGTQIAFHRISGPDSGLYIVSALGGPEKKLRSTRIPSDYFPTISWSPDGRSIAFSDWLPSNDHTAIYLLSTTTGDTERIPSISKCLGEVQPAFSHTGDQLGYWCDNGREVVLYSLPLQGGEPKLVSSFQDSPAGLAWSADDKELIYCLWSGLFGEVNVADGSVRTLALAATPELPAISAKGDKLAFTSYSSTPNIWRRDLAHPQSPPVELVPSSRAQSDAQYSPDGKRIMFISTRSGMPGVWISDEDGSNLVQVSNPAQPGGSPQWSPDGKKIAFDSPYQGHWGIYLADVTERKPEKLVTNISDATLPHWSRDGKWIYFKSSEPGKMGVYRCPASDGDAVALSKDIDGYSPQESFDGKTVYFASHDQKSKLMNVALPPQPGTESEVDGFPRLSDSSLWAVSPVGIYFVPAEAPRSLRYFDFAGKQTREIFALDQDFASGLSVSPDGRSILYSKEGDINSDIMLVDHFH